MSEKVWVPDGLRWPTVAGLLIAAVAHGPVIPEHLHQAPYMGWLFVAFTAAALLAAAVVAVRGLAPVAVVGVGLLSAVAILTYCLTRVVAFPQLADDVGNWTEPLGLVSIVSETVVLALVSVPTFRKKRSNRAFVANNR